MSSVVYMWLAIGLTSLVTYLLRVVPLVALRRGITSRWVQGFLYYVPWAVLTAMVIPGVFTATSSPISATCGFVAAVGLALSRRSLITVAVGAAAVVLVI